MDSDSFVSMKHNVEFTSILDQYSCNEDLIVNFEFGDYVPQDGDRIAIFKLGWSSVRDYVCFEWVPTKVINKRCQVVFKKNVLPKSGPDMFQICYINKDNELHGASSPFQVSVNVNPMTTSVESKKSLVLIDKIKDEEICRLKQENQMLIGALRLVVQQEKSYQQEVSNMKSIMDKQTECIKNLQMEMKLIKEQLFGGNPANVMSFEKKLDDLKQRENEKVLKANMDIGDLKSIPPCPFQ